MSFRRSIATRASPQQTCGQLPATAHLVFHHSVSRGLQSCVALVPLTQGVKLSLVPHAGGGCPRTAPRDGHLTRSNGGRASFSSHLRFFRFRPAGFRSVAESGARKAVTSRASNPHLRLGSSLDVTVSCSPGAIRIAAVQSSNLMGFTGTK